MTKRDGQVVPNDNSIKLGNDAVIINATVLYADLAESTDLVDKQTASFAAEVYKTYLLCATKIIRSEFGEITAFDGERVMAVFLSDSKNTHAVRSALKINYAVRNIINPKIKSMYTSNTYFVKHAVGIDTGKLMVAKTGIRNSNDFVWIGRPANYAAKLCALRKESYATWITGAVYDKMNESIKEIDGLPIWEQKVWPT